MRISYWCHPPIYRFWCVLPGNARDSGIWDSTSWLQMMWAWYRFGDTQSRGLELTRQRSARSRYRHRQLRSPSKSYIFYQRTVPRALWNNAACKLTLTLTIRQQNVRRWFDNMVSNVTTTDALSYMNRWTDNLYLLTYLVCYLCAQCTDTTTERYVPSEVAYIVVLK